MDAAAASICPPTAASSPEMARPLAIVSARGSLRVTLLHNGQSVPRVLREGDKIMAGRSQSCDLRLNDNRVSQQHLLLIACASSDPGSLILSARSLSRNGVRVVRSGSHHGISLGQDDVTEDLQDGDEIFMPNKRGSEACYPVMLRLERMTADAERSGHGLSSGVLTPEKILEQLLAPMEATASAKKRRLASISLDPEGEKRSPEDDLSATTVRRDAAEDDARRQVAMLQESLLRLQTKLNNNESSAASKEKLIVEARAEAQQKSVQLESANQQIETRMRQVAKLECSMRSLEDAEKAAAAKAHKEVQDQLLQLKSANKSMETRLVAAEFAAKSHADDLEMKLNALNKEKTAQVDNLALSYDTAESRARDAHAKVRSLEENISSLERQHKEHMTDAQNQIAAATDLNAAAQKRCTQLETALMTCENRELGWAESKANLESKIDSKNKKLTKLHNIHASLKAEAAEGAKAKEAAISENMVAASLMSEAKETERTARAELAANSELENTVHKLEANLAESEARLQHFREHAEEATCEAEKKAECVTRLHASEKSLRDKLACAEANASSQIGELRLELVDAGQRFRAIESTLDSVRMESFEEKEAATETIEAKAAATEMLEAKAAAYREDLAATRKRNAELEDSLVHAAATAKASLAAGEVKVATVEGEAERRHREMVATVQSLEAALAASAAKCADGDAKLAAVQSEADRRHAEMLATSKTCESKLQELEAVLADSAAKASDAEANLALLQGEAAQRQKEMLATVQDLEASLTAAEAHSATFDLGAGEKAWAASARALKPCLGINARDNLEAKMGRICRLAVQYVILEKAVEQRVQPSEALQVLSGACRLRAQAGSSKVASANAGSAYAAAFLTLAASYEDSKDTRFFDACQRAANVNALELKTAQAHVMNAIGDSSALLLK